MKHSTESPTIDHLDYLDGWRGLAITFLLIGHFFPVPGINLGTVGVNLFFVLSGYLMGQLLFIKHTPIPRFYRRRISRIVPAHVFFLFAVVVFFVAAGRVVNWNETLAALFFVNNYFSGELGNNIMPFGHVWTLCVEEHSYILLSLVALASRSKWVEAKWAVAAITVCFSAAGFWYWTHYDGPELNFVKWIHTEVSAYGIFASTFFLLAFAKIRVPALPAFAYPALFCIGIMLHWWSVPNPVRTTVGVGMMALTINLLINAPPIVKRVLSVKVLRMMGLWSFSIYLWQQPFYLAVYKGSLPVHTAIIAAVGCGVASFYLLERPLRTYLNRVWKGSVQTGLGIAR